MQRILLAGLLACLTARGESLLLDVLDVLDAVRQSDQPRLRTLLAEEVDVNAASVDGMTALHWAAQLEDTDAVEAAESGR